MTGVLHFKVHFPVRRYGWMIVVYADLLHERGTQGNYTERLLDMRRKLEHPHSGGTH